MTRRKIIEYCLTFSAAYEDYPFDVAVDERAFDLIAPIYYEARRQRLIL
jgi:hypothetical protein